MNQTIKTDRLVLRMFDESDTEDLTTILKGEGMLQYFPPKPEPSVELAQKMITGICEHWDSYGYGLWAVELGETGQLLGRVGLQYLLDTDEVEVDFILDRKAWGRGYATEGGRVSIEHGFAELEVDEIVGIVHPDNVASRRVLQKIGMRLDRRTEYFGMTVDRYSIPTP